jgi:hypothetical protein
VCSADFHDEHKRAAVIEQLMQDGKHTVEEVRELEAKFLMHGEEKEDKSIYHAWPFYLQWPTYQYALHVLNHKIKHYIDHGQPDQLQDIVADVEQEARREAREDAKREEEDDDDMDVEEVVEEDGGQDGTVADSDSDNDGEAYEEPSHRNEYNIVMATRRHREARLQRKRDVAKVRAKARRKASPSSGGPAHPVYNGLSIHAFARLKELSGKYPWTAASKYQPALWEHVFSHVNNTFLQAKPDASKLKALTPMYGVKDYRARQLSFHLLPKNRSVEKLRRCELLAWDSAYKVLDEDGFLVDKFIVKLQASIDEHLLAHGGWHADDSITSPSDSETDEREAGHDEEAKKPAHSGSAPSQAHVSSEEKKNSEQLAVSASVAEAEAELCAPPRLPSTANPHRPRSSATTSTPSARHASQPVEPPLAAKTTTRPKRTHRSPDRLDPSGTAGAKRGAPRKSRRTIEPVNSQDAQLPLIPGVDNSGTLADVLPKKLLAGGVAQHSDEPDQTQFDDNHCPPTSTAVVTAESVDPLCFASLGASVSDADSLTLPRPSTLAPMAAFSSTSIDPLTAASPDDITYPVSPTHESEMDNPSFDHLPAPTEPPTSSLSAVSATQLLDALPSQHSVDSERETQLATEDEEMMEYAGLQVGDTPQPVDGNDGVGTHADKTDAQQQRLLQRTAVVITDEIAVDDIMRGDVCQAVLDAIIMEEKAQSSADESIWSVACSKQSEDGSDSSPSY